MVLSGCPEPVTDKRESRFSAIVPPPLLLEDLTPIELKSPLDGAGVAVNDKTTDSVTFRFDTTDIAYSALFIFKSEPAVTDNAISDLASSCLGGVTNMATQHAWNDGTVVLAYAASNQVYACSSGQPTDALSTQTKLPLVSDTFTKGNTYYWAVLGYDNKYRLTHSSTLRRIVIE
jgi:hypothetical protein